MEKSRAILVCFDGAGLGFIDKFLDDMPNFKKLFAQGCVADAVPGTPVDTGTNWKTIETGAWPGTHGWLGFFTHVMGESFEKGHLVFDSDLSKTESLWEAMERGGKKSILINFPSALPSKTTQSIIIGGDGPTSCKWYISSPTSHGTARTGKQKMELAEAKGWSNLPDSHSPPLAARVTKISSEQVVQTAHGIEIVEGGSNPWDMTGAGSPPHHLGIDTTQKTDLFYDLLVIDPAGNGYDEVWLCRGHDAADCLGKLKPGTWSNVMTDVFPCRQGQTEGAFRMSVMELAPDGSALDIEISGIQTTEGWTRPAELGKEICKDIGPLITAFEICPHRRGAQAVLSTMRIQSDYLTDLSVYLADKTDWDLLAVQVHNPDTFNHRLLGDLWEKSPVYDRELAAGSWKTMRLAYVEMDHFLGRLWQEVAGPNDYIAIVSDHGSLPFDWSMSLHGILMDAGLCAYRWDDEIDRFIVDWKKSKAVPFYNSDHVFVNLKGRDPHGIVEPGEEYEKVRDQIVEALSNFRNHENGDSPFEVVIRKESAEKFGVWGNSFGDVIYFPKCGYRIALRQACVLTRRQAEFDKEREAGWIKRHHGAGHSYLPTATDGIMSAKTPFAIAGPGVRKGYRRKHSIDLVDVAPLLASLVSAPQPKHAEGKAPLDFLI